MPAGGPDPPRAYAGVLPSAAFNDAASSIYMDQAPSTCLPAAVTASARALGHQNAVKSCGPSPVAVSRAKKGRITTLCLGCTWEQKIAWHTAASCMACNAGLNISLGIFIVHPLAYFIIMLAGAKMMAWVVSCGCTHRWVLYYTGTPARSPSWFSREPNCHGVHDSAARMRV